MNLYSERLHKFFTEKKVGHQVTGDEQQVLLFQQQIKDTNVVLRLAVITNVDDQSICIHARNLCMVKEVTDGLLQTLNEFNRKYRWITCYIDRNSEIVMRADSLVTPGNVGDLAMQLMLRMISIAADLYPALMKAVWA
ncbi:YbjN domain-containing protein [Candidatus Soleaferrea massiliensis]|uniref:YbjN domain-containing protein n=1 Tax=Candidatus Soleaferrea massiliensis TaxID=1470354 RepID=UPI00058BFE49|nr:YbjN domain-containing protein [Candidatus Soleaferrea massiliensis]